MEFLYSNTISQFHTILIYPLVRKKKWRKCIYHQNILNYYFAILSPQMFFSHFSEYPFQSHFTPTTPLKPMTFTLLNPMVNYLFLFYMHLTQLIPSSRKIFLHLASRTQDFFTSSSFSILCACTFTLILNIVDLQGWCFQTSSLFTFTSTYIALKRSTHETHNNSWSVVFPELRTHLIVYLNFRVEVLSDTSNLTCLILNFW